MGRKLKIDPESISPGTLKCRGWTQERQITAKMKKIDVPKDAAAGCGIDLRIAIAEKISSGSDPKKGFDYHCPRCGVVHSFIRT